MEVILKHRLIQRELTCSLGFLGSSPGKGSACNAGDLSLIPGSGRFAGEGIGYPLQYSWASLVAQLVWRIRLQCGRPGFDPWVGMIPWRRERLPTPVFWPEEFHGLCRPWFIGLQRVSHDWVTFTYTYLHIIPTPHSYVASLIIKILHPIYSFIDTQSPKLL